MTTKTNGPLQVDVQRLIRACRREGVPKFEYQLGGVTIVVWLDDTYLEKLARGQPPAPDLPGERKKHDW